MAFYAGTIALVTSHKLSEDIRQTTDSGHQRVNDLGGPSSTVMNVLGNCTTLTKGHCDTDGLRCLELTLVLILAGIVAIIPSDSEPPKVYARTTRTVGLRLQRLFKMLKKLQHANDSTVCYFLVVNI